LADLISLVLDLKPTRSYDIGDKVDPKRYPDGPFRKNSLWSISSSLSDSAGLAAHLQALTAMLDTKREALLSLQVESRQRLSAACSEAMKEHHASKSPPTSLVGAVIFL